MGLQLPKRAAAPVRRLAMGALLAATLLFLSACDATDRDQIARLAMPEPATAQAPHTFELWKWSWVAAMITGVLPFDPIGMRSAEPRFDDAGTFIASSFVRSPVDYRAIFQKSGGQWRLRAFVAGD
mgnify:CR=1 FL=1